MSKIRIGLMGCGVVADYAHLPAIRQCKGLELVSIFDPSESNLAAAKAKFAVPQAFTDSEAFFRSGIDAVAITSPAPCHRANVLDAARHGKHVLCEKPLADDARQSAEMIEAMAAARLRLYVGFCYRFSPAAIQIKQLVDAGAIGRLRSLRLIYIWNVHGKFDASGNENLRRRGRMLEGGPMVDCGTHQIDLARWWAGGEITRFDAHGAWVDEFDAPDHMWVHMDHASGAHTMVEISYSYTHTASEPVHHFHYDLIGDEGVIRYNREQQLFEVRNRRGTQKLVWHHEKGFEAMYDEFARVLLTGQESALLPTGRDGLEVTRIARESTEMAMAKRVR